MKRLTDLALVMVVVGASAGAQSRWARRAPNTGAVTSVESSANVKPRFYGFTLRSHDR